MMGPVLAIVLVMLGALYIFTHPLTHPHRHTEAEIKVAEIGSEELI